MIKNKLDIFIQKYSLSGLCQKVTLVSDKGKLKTSALSDAQDIAVEVKFDDVGLPDGSFSVFDTKKLSSIMSVLGPEIQVTVENDQSGVPLNLVLTSGKIDVNFVLADASIIPKVPTPKSTIVYDVAFPLEPEFYVTLIKSESALKEATAFNIKSKGNGKIEFIVGEAGYNSNKIKLNVDVDKADKAFSLKFATSPFIAALSANKDAETRTLHVCISGLLKLICEGPGYVATYHLFSVK